MFKENLLIIGKILLKIIVVVSYVCFIGLVTPEIENHSLALVLLVATAIVVFLLIGKINHMFNKYHDKMRERYE